MSRQVKISIDLKAANRRVNKSNGMRCLTHCPKLAERNDAGVTFKSVKYCPVKAQNLMSDTAVCDYGRRLIASRQVCESQKKARARKTHGNGPRSSRKKSR